jgi:hypothetical protein
MLKKMVGEGSSHSTTMNATTSRNNNNNTSNINNNSLRAPYSLEESRALSPLSFLHSFETLTMTSPQDRKSPQRVLLAEGPIDIDTAGDGESKSETERMRLKKRGRREVSEHREYAKREQLPLVFTGKVLSKLCDLQPELTEFLYLEVQNMKLESCYELSDSTK